MKVILDINDKARIPFFMELMNSLNYIKVVKEIENEQKNRFINDLIEAFDDVRLHEEGKIKLKSAKQLLNEL